MKIKNVIFINTFLFPILLYALSFGNPVNGRDSQRDDVLSVFFIIDNSGSMYNEPYQFDRWGKRFHFVENMLDTLFQLYPSAEVGVSVFGTNLYFDINDDSTLFSEVSGYSEDYYQGAYIPLLTLDSTFDFAQGCASGYGILKYYLETDTSFSAASGDSGYIGLIYKPLNIELAGTGTCITAAFEAAKDAFSKSCVSKENQFIYFFSDGEGTYPNSNDFIKNLYIEGENVPTTITTFFTDDSNIPSSIDSMTQNIRDNGYSSNNQLSAAFPYNNGLEDDFLSFYMNMLVSAISPSSIKLKKNKLDYNLTCNMQLLSNKKIRVNSYSNKDLKELEIYQLNGKLIQKVSINNGSIIDLDKPLAHGVYLYKIHINGNGARYLSGKIQVN